jgi:hypothetical protein
VLVCPLVFKTSVAAMSCRVGSIPTHSRHLLSNAEIIRNNPRTLCGD